jgi:predicted ATPase
LHYGDSKQKRSFEFDEVFDEAVSQDSLFSKLKLDSLIKKVLEGFNATIFAYGPTGSGKTFTMEGFDFDRNLKPVAKVNSK